MRRLAPALILAVAGCGRVYVEDPAGRAESMLRAASEGAPVPLEACIGPVSGGESSILYRIGADALRRTFSQSSHVGSPTCDVRFEVTASSTWLWKAYSARNGQFLFAVRGQAGGGSNLREWMRAAVQDKLKPGSPLLARLAAERGSAPRPAAAVAALPPAASFSSTVETPSYRLPERPDDLAVIVGIEEYSDLPRAPYAERDAQAVAEHVRALGVPQRNLVLLAGQKAGRASLQKYLEHWLPNLVKPGSRVYFYFSGHGAPDVKTGQAYLVPWDGDANFLESTAYPVKKLYDRLAALKARHVFVALDACFSGAGGRSVLASGARPLVTKIDTAVPPAGITALAASGPNEISGSLDERGHGAFTYFLLEGLNGGAKDLSAAGLLRYVEPRVRDEARRLNRDQTPQLYGDGALTLR